MTEHAFEKRLISSRHRGQVPILRRTWVYTKAEIEKRVNREAFEEFRALPLRKMVALWWRYSMTNQ